MSVITVPQSRFPEQPLTEEDAQTSSFVCEVGNIIAQLDKSLDEAIAQFACDFEIDEVDYIRTSSARQHLLRQVASFILQRPVVAREVVQEHLLTFEAVDTFFYDFKSNPLANFSPSDEKPVQAAANVELKALRKENAKLQAEIATMHREKELVEQQALNALRRRPTRHNRTTYSSSDEMFTGMMTEAVAEGVRQVLGEGKANV